MNGQEEQDSFVKLVDIISRNFTIFSLNNLLLISRFFHIIKYISMINQSKGPKIYKKGKTNLEGSSYRSSLAQSSKIRVENSDKKYDYGVEEQNWIGTDRTDGSRK